MWKGIYDAMEITKTKKLNLLNIKDQKTGKIYENSKEISDMFAQYFESVPINVRDKLPNNKYSFSEYLHTPTKQSMYFYETNPLEVFNIIINLKNNCSTGNVNISNKFLKLIAFPLSYMLAYIANRSFKFGRMPDCLKVGKKHLYLKMEKRFSRIIVRLLLEIVSPRL